ncbi:MAG: phosphocholine cytidylyltransferase family protein [Elusimicrobia bacterium]|nr:phosphocholine cytidylyltransferase family protein [Elusimicrobiota bacterium]
MKNINAIILAAGLGTRLKPLTDKIPKPLISINNQPIIESLIVALQNIKITKIFIIVGYLAEQFEYLTKKYSNVELIYNKDYKNVNNISSIYFAREVFRQSDCFICESDLLVLDENILNIDLEHSCYFGEKIYNYTDDWVFDLNKEGFISRIGKKGSNCYKMVGVSYFKKKEAEIISREIEKKYHIGNYENLFWDEVVNENLDNLKLVVHPISKDKIIEIDTIQDLENTRNAMELI